MFFCHVVARFFFSSLSPALTSAHPFCACLSHSIPVSILIFVHYNNRISTNRTTHVLVIIARQQQCQSNHSTQRCLYSEDSGTDEDALSHGIKPRVVEVYNCNNQTSIAFLLCYVYSNFYADDSSY